MRAHHLLLAVGFIILGCEGSIDDVGVPPGPPDPPTGPVDPATCVEPVPAAQPLRRLSSEQYARVLAELVPGLGTELLDRSRFPETVIDHGFATDANANTVSTFESNQIEDNAELLAAYILENAATAIPAITGCVSGEFSDAELDACFDTFLPSFAERAFRRPIRPGEDSIARDLYASIRAEQGSRPAFATVMQLLLQSPSLLYRSERGRSELVDGASPLTGHEVAERLSFFMSGGLPDETLRDLAGRDALGAEEVALQAARLGAEPSFTRTLSEFHRDWMHAYVIDREARDHPLFTPEAQRALAGEVAEYTRWLMNDSDGRFRTLMTSGEFPVPAELAAIYNVGSADGSAQPVAGRGGILTLASVMAGFTSADTRSSNPIVRGAFIREAVLCGGVLTLPNNDGLEEELEPTAHLPTAKGRLSFLEARSDCAGCHSQINPLGLAFENFDALGAHRTTENGATIDPSGTLRYGELDGTFETPAELVSMLARSEQAQACYATQLYRYAMGRLEVAADACTLARVQQRFIESDGDIRDLAVAIATSRPFLTRAPVED